MNFSELYIKLSAGKCSEQRLVGFIEGFAHEKLNPRKVLQIWAEVDFRKRRVHAELKLRRAGLWEEYTKIKVFERGMNPGKVAEFLLDNHSGNSEPKSPGEKTYESRRYAHLLELRQEGSHDQLEEVMAVAMETEPPVIDLTRACDSLAIKKRSPKKELKMRTKGVWAEYKRLKRTGPLEYRLKFKKLIKIWFENYSGSAESKNFGEETGESERFALLLESRKEGSHCQLEESMAVEMATLVELTSAFESLAIKEQSPQKAEQLPTRKVHANKQKYMHLKSKRLQICKEYSKKNKAEEKMCF